MYIHYSNLDDIVWWIQLSCIASKYTDLIASEIWAQVLIKLIEKISTL